MAGEMTAMSPRLRWHDHAAGEGATPAPHEPPRTRVPEKLANDAVAHEEAVGGDKLRMTFWVILRRQQAEALAARAIRERRTSWRWWPRFLGWLESRAGNESPTVS